MIVDTDPGSGLPVARVVSRFGHRFVGVTHDGLILNAVSFVKPMRGNEPPSDSRLSDLGFCLTGTP